MLLMFKQGKLVLVIICLGGRFENIFENLEITRVKWGQFQHFQKSRRWFIPKITRTKHVVTVLVNHTKLTNTLHWNYTVFYKQQFYKQLQVQIGKKIKQTLRKSLKLKFTYLIIIQILHPRYHPKIIGGILKNKQKSKRV